MLALRIGLISQLVWLLAHCDKGKAAVRVARLVGRLALRGALAGAGGGGGGEGIAEGGRVVGGGVLWG